MRVSHPQMTIHEILFAEISKCETQALIKIHFENYLLLEYWKGPRKDTVIEQCKISWSQKSYGMAAPYCSLQNTYDGVLYWYRSMTSNFRIKVSLKIIL